MRATRANVSRDARRQHNDVANVNRLPDELISEIFKQGLIQRNCDRERYLAKLLGICSLWRQIALATKTLWTSIRYRSRRRVGEEVVALEMLKQYLQRAGENTVIDLHLVVRFEASHRMMRDLISVVLGHIHRSRTIVCHTTVAQFMDAIFPLAGPFPSLENLEVCLVHADHHPVTLLGHDCVSSLQTLNIDGNLGVELSNVQTELLTRLDIFNPTALLPVAFGQLLRRCPNLQSLCSDTLLPEVTTPIHLPHLTHLVTGTSFPLPASLISAPQLRHLRIFDRAEGHTADVIPARFEELRTVEIAYVYASPDDVIRFLRSHSKLVAITLMFDRALPILRSLARRYTLEREAQEPLGLLCLRTDFQIELGLSDTVLRELLQSLPRLHLALELEDLPLLHGVSELMASFPGRVSLNWSREEVAAFVDGLISD